MIRNLVLVAFRRLLRERCACGVNIGGLAVALAVATAIVSYVDHQVSYDRHLPLAHRTYRIVRVGKSIVGSPTTTRKVSGGIAPLLKSQCPEVEAAVRINIAETAIRRGETALAQDLCVTDVEALGLFGVEFLEGDSAAALRQPNTILLTESSARRLFPSENALGKSVSFERVEIGGNFTVTGVIRDPPRTSSIRFDCLTAVASLPTGSVPAATTPLLAATMASLWDEWNEGGSYHPAEVLILMREGALAQCLERHSPPGGVRPSAESRLPSRLQYNHSG